MRVLAEEEAGEDPLILFARWYAEAETRVSILPEAMSLATATASGRPSVRLVLLKGYDERGFAFYTNTRSRKAAELDANPRAAVAFHWPELERQVRVEGTTEPIPEPEAAAYFATRPRASRISAWASPQSQVVDSREALERRAREMAAEFDEGDIPLPPFWGGYRVVPERIEFWQGRAGRLHDRLLYVRDGGGWERSRLAP